jgi:nitrite reductase/ring-hydroxylating ferredoxin subunit/uncharacterized membrane protein
MSAHRRPRRPVLHGLAERIGELQALDGPAEALAKAVRRAVPAGPVKDVLSGTPLGHPLHPVLTDLPIGTWTSALLLDVLGGRAGRRGADRLVALGLLTATPTAVTGLTEWADTTVVDPTVRRVGAVHAVANVGALALFGASLAARRGERRGAGVLLALAGAGALTAGGHLGGHMTYAQGVGIDRTAFEAEPDDWRPTVADSDLGEGALHQAVVDGHDVLLVRSGGSIHALAGRCTHRGGPLADGELVDGCVQCPWHGSRFALEDGSVERGPAAFPQPRYETRVREGRVEVRRAQP